MIRSLKYEELAPVHERPTYAAADGSAQVGTEFGVDLILALDPKRERPGDEVILGKASALPLSGITLEELDNLKAQAQTYKYTPTGSGLSNAIGLGPSGAVDFLVMAALQGSTLLRAGDNSRAYLSECPELRTSYHKVKRLPILPNGYPSILDSAKSWRIGLGGFCDPRHGQWGEIITAWTDHVVRDKWATILRSPFLGDDIAKPSDTLPPAGKSSLVAAHRQERLVYLIKYLMRRPGFRLMAHVLDVLLYPAHASYLKMRYEIGWPSFERRAREFLSKEKFPSLMNFGDEFVGSAVFHGVGGISVAGYVYDRDLWKIPLVELPSSIISDAEVPQPGPNGKGQHLALRQIVDQWGSSSRDAMDDPALKRLFELDDDIMQLWEPADHFLRDWEVLRIQEEDPTTGSLATTAPDVWGMKNRPAGGASRTVGSDLLDYTVLGGHYATGPASRNLRGMLVSPLLNYVAEEGDNIPSILWKSARSVCSLPLAAQALPRPGGAFATKNVVYVEPQNLEGRHIFTTDRFDPRTVRPVKDWKGEPEFIPVARTIDMLAILGAFPSLSNLARAIERHPERWEHLATSKDGVVKLTPGGDLFESSLTRKPYLVPVEVPRKGLSTRVATWVGPPAGLRPFRGWFTGADIEFTNQPYTVQVDVSQAATTLASELAGL